jgi:hypothetical protein
MDEAMELKQNDRVFLIGGDIFGTVYFRSKDRPQAVCVVWDHPGCPCGVKAEVE